MSHTPGPWTLTTVPTQVGICHKIGPFPWKAGRTNHACVYVDYPGGGPVEVELLANARLIAAAPDLLQALKDMVHLFYGYQGLQLTEAHAAILKAEPDFVHAQCNQQEKP